MGLLNTEVRELTIALEEHEAAVWAEAITAASMLPDNPLDAVIDHSGSLPVWALRAIDRPDLNRVVGLGVRAPASVDDLDAIWSFYEAQGQRHFRIEVTPLAEPAELATWIAARGLRSSSPGTFKISRRVDPEPELPCDVEVRRLGAADADAISKLNVIAWGAWSTPVMGHWFRATVGRTGVNHYGVFDGNRLVATGSLFVRDEIGWFGFDATHPRCQGRTLRQAISAVRMKDAAALGCEIIHAESAIQPGARALRDWRLLYEKQNFETVVAPE